jgi:hypothetical protein
MTSKFGDLPNFRRQFDKSFLFDPTVAVGVIFDQPPLRRHLLQIFPCGFFLWFFPILA